MHRRRFLTLAGGAVAMAGCMGGPATSPTPTETSSPTEDPTADRRLSVSDPAVQPGVVALTSPDSIGLYAEAGQYLVVRVEVVAGDAPPPIEFEFRFDGETHSPGEYSSGLWRDGDYRVGYEAEDGRGWLVFELPETGDASDARLSWPGGEWAPPAAVRERLAAPLPSFDVDFSAPESVARGETPTLSLSVTNRGEVAGTAVLAMNRVGPNVAYTPVRDVVWDVAPGETRTEQWPAEQPTADREVVYFLHGADIDRQKRTIRLADAGNSTETT